MKILAAKLNAMVGKGDNLSFKLFNRVIDETAIDLLAGKGKSVEERRIRWTTHRNLVLWFESWESEMENLGFA